MNEKNYGLAAVAFFQLVFKREATKRNNLKEIRQHCRKPTGASEFEKLGAWIPQAVKRRFKAHAAMRGIAPHELFVEVWEHYERTRQ